MKLPRLGATVVIRFPSLRTRHGLMGSTFGCDEIVQRKCRRVLLPNLDWKWQIVNYDKLFEWGHSVDQDKEVLDAYGSELEFELVRVAA